MAQIKDTTGQITTGSISLPRSKTVPIGKPLTGVAIAVLKQELLDIYGDRFEVVEAAKDESKSKTPAQKKPAGGEVKEGEG